MTSEEAVVARGRKFPLLGGGGELETVTLGWACTCEDLGSDPCVHVIRAMMELEDAALGAATGEQESDGG
jgi:hypothetical protein